jgi:hypothetical protein
MATSPIRRRSAGDSATFAHHVRHRTGLAAAVVDLSRSGRSLLTEIALFRHEIAVLERSVARPHVTRLRIPLVALAVITPTWRNVLRAVQPETLLRWHRAGFKALWRWRSRPGSTLRIAAETVALHGWPYVAHSATLAVARRTTCGIQCHILRSRSGRRRAARLSLAIF